MASVDDTTVAGPDGHREALRSSGSRCSGGGDCDSLCWSCGSVGRCAVNVILFFFFCCWCCRCAVVGVGGDLLVVVVVSGGL